MTVRLETSIKRWIGLSTDAKPTPGYALPGGSVLTAADVPTGSTFKDDEGYISTWNGVEWSVSIVATEQPLVDAITMLTAEVAKLRLGMIDAGSANEVSDSDALAVIAA